MTRALGGPDDPRDHEGTGSSAGQAGHRTGRRTPLTLALRGITGIPTRVIATPHVDLPLLDEASVSALRAGALSTTIDIDNLTYSLSMFAQLPASIACERVCVSVPELANLDINNCRDVEVFGAVGAVRAAVRPAQRLAIGGPSGRMVVNEATGVTTEYGSCRGIAARSVEGSLVATIAGGRSCVDAHDDAVVELFGLYDTVVVRAMQKSSVQIRGEGVTVGGLALNGGEVTIAGSFSERIFGADATSSLRFNGVPVAALAAEDLYKVDQVLETIA